MLPCAGPVSERTTWLATVVVAVLAELAGCRGATAGDDREVSRIDVQPTPVVAQREDRGEASSRPSAAAMEEDPEPAGSGLVERASSTDAPAEPDASVDGLVQAIEDPTGTALAGFRAALARTEAKEQGALTRVLHMGDSSIGLDGVPHAIRRRMQDRFGDGGAGFVLLGRRSPNYKNNAVTLSSNEAWQICYIAYLCRGDGHYGLGGHTFRASTGARTTLRTKTSGSYGREVSRFELWYSAQPGGGRVRLRVDRNAPEVIETRAETPEDRWHELQVEKGGHTFTVEAGGAGRVNLYGVVMETEGPGVVWDTVSMIGAFTKRLHGYDAAHIAGQVAHRDPDLLVLSYGGNDLRRFVSGSADAQTYKDEYREVIRKLRAGKPTMSCLVVSVIDHGRSGTHTVQPRHTEAMVQAQREVAFEEGCAFFDAVAAMGGPGSLREWLRSTPRLAEPDLKHLNHRGRDRMGEMIYAALVDRYRNGGS
jgi:lysophospholipase L1-like esterase